MTPVGDRNLELMAQGAFDQDVLEAMEEQRMQMVTMAKYNALKL